MPFEKHTAIDWKKVNPALWQLDGISAKTMDAHMTLYNGYVSKYNEIMEAIENLPSEELTAPKPNPTYSQIRVLKVELTRAIGGIKNHEIYFAQLGGKGGKPSGDLLRQIEKDFGSYERFEQELRATAIAARGWAWLAWDKNWNRLFVLIGDEQNTFPVWNATPILALDVFEHAYFIDFGTGKPAYIDAFFKNLNWDDVAERLAEARK